MPEQDLAFLARDEARGVRLQIEYLKPATLLTEHAVRDTVVVYGRFTELIATSPGPVTSSNAPGAGRNRLAPFSCCAALVAPA